MRDPRPRFLTQFELMAFLLGMGFGMWVYAFLITYIELTYPLYIIYGMVFGIIAGVLIIILKWPDGALLRFWPLGWVYAAEHESVHYCPHCGPIPAASCLLTPEGLMHKCLEIEDNIRLRSAYSSKQQYEKLQAMQKTSED